MKFHIDSDTLFQYLWTRTSASAGFGEAIGDLDCDGTIDAYRLNVSVIEGVVQVQRQYPLSGRTESKTVSVAAHRWELSIGVEQYENQIKHDWEDQVPRGAVASDCELKERSKRQIPDGEDCKIEKVDKKDGTFEKVKKCKPKFRSEPVEDRWCTFTVREWREVDRIKSAGGGTTPAWPSQGLPAEQYSEVLGAKRRGSKTQTLWLDMAGLETKQSCDVNETAWKKYADGAKLQVEVRSRTGEVICDSL